MPEITENQTPVHKPQRKKNKETHNAVERDRKKKINAGINRIGELLPCSQALKQSKNMILDQAFRYIVQLKQQNDTLLLDGGDRAQAEEIRRLRRQVEELRKESSHYMELLKANGISFLDDPTVHWKGKLGQARVAKVTPARLLPDGLIVYSNGNVLCPVRDEPARKPPLRDAPLPPPAKAQAAPKTAPALSYITLQGLCPLPPDSSAPPLAPPPLTQAPALPPQPALSHALCPGAPLGLHSTGGATQTTWTTLQLGGHCVQPACPPLPAPTPRRLCPLRLCTQPAGGDCVLSRPQALRSACPRSLHPGPGAPCCSAPSPAPAPPHPALLPLLQALQVLQVRAPPGAPAPQSSTNPNVFILQPANPCPPAAVVRNGLPNQNPCQHIVIIQTANQSPALPNSQGGVGPAAVSAANPIAVSGCAAGSSTVQTVGGKQLVHILPRPLTSAQTTPAATAGSQVAGSQAAASAQTTQTVTVNGQVFALQALKPQSGTSAQSLQIVQPTTSEDPSVNVTLHSLGALASLNQSISQIPPPAPPPHPSPRSPRAGPSAPPLPRQAEP
ncbi:hypothetical protein MATL_G00021570 [Megalops atlanticus]|uniref:BHLH domain-containing protein n=1 Tax=Megalops atlanticus TaxID=7932 RepID=A0A9D3QDB2_MEGAT|nr:hypothetical protein MATL_G00021570 [Megalops atlanticus]